MALAATLVLVAPVDETRLDSGPVDTRHRSPSLVLPKTFFQQISLKDSLSGFHDLKAFCPQIIRPGVRRKFLLGQATN
jgi:hypothetical protein